MGERSSVYDFLGYESLPIPILIVNQESSGFAITSANKAAELLLNTSEQNIIRRSFAEAFTTDSTQQQHLNQCLQRVNELKQNQTICITLPSDKYIDILFSPVLNEQGTMLHITAIITDVTEMMRAKQQEIILTDLLNKKEKFLYETERVARNGTWEIDLKTNTVLWSHMMWEIYEIDTEVPLDYELTLRFLKDDENRQKVRTAVEEAIVNGNVFDIEVQMITARGNLLWIRCTGKADLTHGICTRLYGTFRDITEEKKIKDALIESRNKRQSLIQSIDGIVWEANAQTFEFNFVSNQVQNILGYTSEEWLSEPDFWSKHIYAEDRNQAVNFCIMETKEARNHTFDYRMVKADGNIVWIKDMVSVITEEGKPSLLRGIMVDITETKLLDNLDRLEKQILELNSKKGIEVETVLQEYVQGFERLLPSMKCSVLRVKNNRIYSWVAPSLPKEYVALLNDIEIGPNICSCGTAAYLKEKVIISDIETDPRCAKHKHLALPYELRSCCSYPVINSEGEVMAVLGIYYATVRTPDANESEIIERSVSLLNVILENRLNAAMIQEKNLLITRGQELANFGTWQWDISENVVTWSDVLYKIYGLDKTTFPATFEGYVAMLHPDDRERITGIIKDVLETHQDVLFEERIIRPDGEERVLRSWGRLILNEEGKPEKMIGACLDITKAKVTQVKLEEIAWLQSHVIRAPLARLIGLVDILQNELSPQAAHDELLNHIVQTAEELDGVVRNISDKTMD